MIKMVDGKEPSPVSPTSARGDQEISVNTATIITSAAASTSITIPIPPPATATAKAAARVTAPAPRQQPPRKRRRIIISCTECHRRKQKCDRALPCTNCVLRNKQDSCRYEAAAPTAKRARESGGLAPTNNPTVGGGEEEEEKENDDDDDSNDNGGDGGDAPRHKRRVPVRRPSKCVVDPRLMMTTPDAGVGGVDDEGSSPGASLLGSGGAGAGGEMANFGYAGMGTSTLGFLKRIDDVQTPGESLSSLAMGRENTAYFGTRERYKSLVRQLPARPYIEKLVDIYFKDFNWQYNGVDQYVFDRQMDEWYSLPFNVLNTEGPQAFEPDMRAFPALVFQMIATSLLILGSGPDPTFDSLKYNSSMTFEDLATDYSESGVALLNLLGKRQVSHTAVIAGWLRAAFLKYSGLVTEAWHALGTTVRDAQECGLHRDALDPQPKSDRLEDILENQWEIQRRRKTWCLLIVWDVHTGVVLGRPISVDLSVPYTLPIDAPTPKDPSRTPVTQRLESDPPSLMTRTLYIHKISTALKDIIELEKEGPCPKDFSKVDRLHERQLELEEQTPAFFRRENPDTRYDDLPECFWIPMVRSQLHPLVSFNFMALHRPYVFTRPRSRREALKASFKMLEAQRANFASLSPRHYKTFQLFFGTFDAVVLMASIFILFPKENAEYVSSALQHLQWAVERFETMAERNRLAASARGVLHAINIRLKKALGVGGGPASGSRPAVPNSSSRTGREAPISTASEGSILDAQNATAAASSPSLAASASNGTRATSLFTTTPESAGEQPQQQQLFGAPGPLTSGHHHPLCDHGMVGLGARDWALPEDFDWGAIQPVYAMADVAYNDLMGISSGSNGGERESSNNNKEAEEGVASMSTWMDGALNNLPRGAPTGAAGGGGWSFGGDFGNDSVWSVLNQFSQF